MTDEKDEEKNLLYNLTNYLEGLGKGVPLMTFEEILEDVGRDFYKPEDYLAVNRWLRICFESLNDADCGLYIQALPHDRTQFNLSFPGQDRMPGIALSNSQIYFDFDNAWRRHVGDELFATLDQSLLVFADLMELWFKDDRFRKETP